MDLSEIKKIIVVEKYNKDDLYQLMRKVTLTKHESIFPYENARISLESTDPLNLSPSSFYVLEDNLRYQSYLRNHLLDKEGVDILRLDGGLVLESGKQTIDLVPPVVEVMGDMPIILDGLHRTFLAKELGYEISHLKISGIDRLCSSYAHGNLWSQVNLESSVPEVKKNYLTENEVLALGWPQGSSYRDLYKKIPGSSGFRS